MVYFVFSFSSAHLFYVHFIFYLIQSMKFQKRQTLFMETHCFQLFWIYRELFIEYCWMLTLLCSVSCVWTVYSSAGWVSSTRLISRAGLCTVFLKWFVFCSVFSKRMYPTSPPIPLHVCPCLLKVSALIYILIFGCMCKQDCRLQCINASLLFGYQI